MRISRCGSAQHLPPLADALQHTFFAQDLQHSRQQPHVAGQHAKLLDEIFCLIVFPCSGRQPHSASARVICSNVRRSSSGRSSSYRSKPCSRLNESYCAGHTSGDGGTVPGGTVFGAPAWKGVCPPSISVSCPKRAGRIRPQIAPARVDGVASRPNSAALRTDKLAARLCSQATGRKVSRRRTSSPATTLASLPRSSSIFAAGSASTFSNRDRPTCAV